MRLSRLNSTVAGLAHQLSQPLGAIANYAVVGLHRLTDLAEADEVRRCLDEIAEQAQRAGSTVQRIRGAVSGGRQSERLPTDLGDLVRQTASHLDHRLRSQRVELRLKLGDGLPKAEIDPVQIEQVIAALVENAADAIVADECRPRRVTVLTALAEDGRLSVAVAGPADAAAAGEVERMFEPFFTTKPDRLGLGLTAGRSIVNAHGGRLEADRNSGAGMVFHFTLPVATGREPH